MKVLFITNLPSPYRVDFFNEWGKYCNLTVVFERNKASNRDDKWIADKCKNFKAINLNAMPIGEENSVSFRIIDILKEEYDHIVVGVYSTVTAMIAITYMRIRKIPFIISSDGGFIKQDDGFKRKFKIFFVGAANMWLSSGKETTKYLAHYGANPERTFVYPFTSIWEKEIVSNVLTQAEKQATRDTLGIPESKVVLTVGRFIPIKGYDVLLKACAKLDASTGVYIVGGKPTDEYLQLQNELGLNNIHFVDFMSKEELSNYYKSSDVFVLPTRGDVWGLVINEAMAHGLPIVTTDKCVAGLELVENDVNGYIVPVDDNIKLGEAICKIVNNEVLKDKMSAKSLQKIKVYTIENMARIHQEFLDGIPLLMEGKENV